MNYVNFVSIQKVLHDRGIEFTAHWKPGEDRGTVQLKYHPEVAPPSDFRELVSLSRLIVLSELGKLAIEPDPDTKRWLVRIQ